MEEYTLSLPPKKEFSQEALSFYECFLQYFYEDFFGGSFL